MDNEFIISYKCILIFKIFMAEPGRENWAVDELLKDEEEANQIIKNA